MVERLYRAISRNSLNAVNYSCDGTEITIEAEGGEDSVKLRFSNRGGTILQGDGGETVSCDLQKLVD